MWNFSRNFTAGGISSGTLGSRSSRNIGRRQRDSQPYSVSFASFRRQFELEYPPWWSSAGFIRWYRDLPDDTLWNCYICAIVLAAVVWVAANLGSSFYLEFVDVVYNISYAVHVIAIAFKMITELEHTLLGFLIDLLSYLHYIFTKSYLKLACYYVRLHRPLTYLFSTNHYNLKCSILGTTLKYCYIFMVLRISWAWIWLRVNEWQHHFPVLPRTRRMGVQLLSSGPNESDATNFISSLYIVNKMFIPIGVPVSPQNDIERLTCLLVIISGCLVVTGAAVASLSLVVSLYMSPEETFRSRYRLIIKDMKESRVPPSMREKVQKFYRMYWHKQRAVSHTRLLPSFPPTLPATIYTDIYFEATQKSRILRELSDHFLSKLVMRMDTIHYIPGDVIMERNAKKSAIMFITYGDIEMLTAEDDMTAILRFTRGTVLAPLGGVALPVVRAHLAVRAATFCTAHVLHAADLWRVVFKYSVDQNYGEPILTAFTDHIEKVKRHYGMKIPVPFVHKSSILHFNRNLIALKEMKDTKGNSLLASTDVFLEIAGCYIMRNRLDSTLTDESDEICLRPTFPCILQPSSSLLLAWHSAVSCLILIICITHPYYLVYSKNAPMRFKFFDYVATAIYVVDHIVHLSTGTQVEEGIPITFAQTSSQQMRSKWFVLDVVGTLPIFELIGDGHFAGINKILRLPKVFRVLKIIEEKCMYHSNVLRFCSYTLLLLIACYLIAAMQQAFMCYHSGYCLVTNFTHSPFWEKKELDEETVASRITFGLYWAISMIMFTTHIETWAKNNISNVMYTMIILEVCIVLRTFMEAVYSATIMVTTAMREDYSARIATVRQFLIRNDVDPELRKRFITYLQLSWYTDKAYRMTHHKQNSSIFYDLPQHVYRDIVGRQRIKYMLSIPVMKMLKIEELNLLASNAHLFYTSPNEILLNTGDLVNEIYVVVKGICEVSNCVGCIGSTLREMISPNTRNTIGYLTTNNHFGAVGCLLRLPAYYTVRAVTHVQIFCISKRHLKPVFENPQVKEAIEYIKTLPLYAHLQTGQQSFLKYEPPTPTPNMSRFKLPRKHEPDYEYLHPFKRLGFLSILRYVFPRFTIRPDGDYLIRYEWVRVSCALMSAMLFPNYTYLVLQWPWLHYVALLLDLSAVFDIFQRMLVGYYNEDGILVYHPSSTAAYYIKGPFIIDLVGCLPLEKLESESIGLYEDMYRVTPMEQFLMMNRLLQLYRFPSITQTLQYYIERRDILMVIYAVPLFLSMFNILTSLMIFNSVKIFSFVKQDGVTGWLLQPFDDKGGSWIDLFGSTFRFNLTSSPFNLYLATHFWVVYETTTTGYAKFKPSNNSLMEILFFGMTMSGMIITYFSVRIISIRANVNKAHAGFKQHMRDITTFMNKEKLDQELMNEMRRYYEYNWEKMGGIDYRGVLKLCDQITLRTDAILHIYGPTFAKCPLLAQCDLSVLRMIGRSVRSVYFLRNMKIVEYDDVVKDIYFVDYGGVESRVPVGDMNQVVRLPRGSLFGNLEGTPAQRVPMNIVATSRLHLLMINSQAFYHIINEFPATKALMDIGRKSDNQHYILGNLEDFKVKMAPESVSAAVPTTGRTRDIFKYIYYQEGAVLLYLIFVSLICMFIDLYNAGYQDNRAWLILTLYILDMCFFLKILMQFSLPLLVTDKNLKTLLPIRTMYFKREFKYDMISCVPIELLAFQSVKNRWLWFSWLRFNRMFRIVTVRNCLRRHSERITVNLVLSTILAVTIWFSLFVHATTCLWYFIGQLEELDEPQSSWIYSADGFNWCRSEYICSLYFVITTFTQNGVGDIMPKKQSEVIFVTILMIISTMVFMVYVGEFSKLIQYHLFRLFNFYSKYLELQEFLKNNRVSNNLVTIVHKYTLHLWRTSRGLQVPRFLTNAPLSLRLRVMSAAYMHHIARHPIFENCEPAFLRQLVGCLRLYIYNEDMYVVKESEITDSMYIIHAGSVMESSEDTAQQVLPRVYPAGSCFGVGLVRDTPYTHTYQTAMKSQVLTLQLEDWEYLLKHFPNSKAIIHKHMGSVADNVDTSKWPGNQDPEPPPAAETKKTDTSNLPKFYRDEPSAFKNMEQSSQEPTITSAPTDSKASEVVGTSQSTQAASEDSLKDKPSKEVNVLELKDSENQREHEVGLIEYFTRAVKKLMGKYSDTDVNWLEPEEEEGATQTLLKQLDEARRISRETVKKSQHKYSESVTVHSKEEENEKYMLSLGILKRSSDENQGLVTDARTSVPRPLQIRDDESVAVTNQDDSVANILDLDENMSPIPFMNTSNAGDTTVNIMNTSKAQATAISRSDDDHQIKTNLILLPVKIERSVTETAKDDIVTEATSEIKSNYMDNTSKGTSIIQETNIDNQVKEDSHDNADGQINLHGNEGENTLESQDQQHIPIAGDQKPQDAAFTSAAPSWGTRVVQETDADIEALPYNQLELDHQNAIDTISSNSSKDNSNWPSKISVPILDQNNDTKNAPELKSASSTGEAQSWGTRIVQETDADLEAIATVDNHNLDSNVRKDNSLPIRHDFDVSSNQNIFTSHSEDAPGWGNRVVQETDADVVAVPDNQLRQNRADFPAIIHSDDQITVSQDPDHKMFRVLKDASTPTVGSTEIGHHADEDGKKVDNENTKASASTLKRQKQLDLDKYGDDQPTTSHTHDQVDDEEHTTESKSGNDTNQQKEKSK